MPNTASPQPMSPWRIALVNGVIALLIFGHLFDIKKKATHWPFGQYEMFSHLSELHSHERMAMMGVTPDGTEFPISGPTYAAPLPSYHARLAFMRADSIKDPAKRQAALSRLAREYLARYAEHRKDGSCSGPPAVAMRLYELRWTAMDADAKNAETPDEKTLLFDSRPAVAAHEERSRS